MQTPNCHGRLRQRWRPPLVSLLMLPLATFAGSTLAVEFDASLKTPLMKNTAEFKAQAREFSTRYSTIRDSAPEPLVLDAALARQQFDLKWQIQNAIDERRPLEELEALGIKPRGDGSYNIDVEAYPVWNDLRGIMTGVLSHDSLDNIAPELVNRGFRPQDVATLKEYVVANNPDGAAAAATLPLSLEFGRVVRKYDKGKRPIPEGLAMSFFYQRAKAHDESQRIWLENLIKRFDAQRVRVLLSTFLELKQAVIWAPDNVAEGVALLLSEIRRPDFEERVKAEAQGVAP